VLAAGFSDFLDVEGLGRVVSDKLPRLVEHDQGQGEFALDGEGIIGELHHLAGAHICDRRVLRTRYGPDLLLCVRHIRIDPQQALRKNGRDLHVGKLGLQGLSLGGKSVHERLVQAGLLQPHHEPSLVDRLGQSSRLEHQTLQGQADVVVSPGAELPGGGVETAQAPTLSRQLLNTTLLSSPNCLILL
jgi:hypothetical protein